MLRSRERQLIFVHNQKAAGTSIGDYLRRHVPDLRGELAEHALAADVIAQLGRAEWDRHYSFGFVRNPWARLVSWHRMVMERPQIRRADPWWFYVRARGARFEDFILHCVDEVREERNGFVHRRSALRNQIDYFTDEAGRDAVNFIGRYEHLARDMAVVQAALGLPQEPLPWVNRTQPGDYRSCYSERTQALVAERFARDIARFDYTFDNGFIAPA